MPYRMMLVGESWGDKELQARTPFVGPSGYCLTRLLDDAGIQRANVYLTNVFQFHPMGNRIDTLCQGKKEDTTFLPPIIPGKYLRPEFLPELERLAEEIREIKPNLVVALGNTASWALLRTTGISRIRGTIVPCVLRPGVKVLPTYHPSAVLQQWDLRSTTVMDLQKARHESTFPEIRRPARTIYIEPELKDIEWFYNEHILSAKRISIDIETRGSEITCVGFAVSPQLCMVIPFADMRKPDGSYWPTLDDEHQALLWVKRFCDTPTPKLFQNGLYDVTFLWHRYGIPVRNVAEDTMLCHHSLQPESKKSLGYLGSILTSEPAWKLMNAKDKTNKTVKRDN